MKTFFYRSLIELTNGRLTSGLLKKFACSRASRPLVKHYAKAYRINLDEMDRPLLQYGSLHDFFTRRLAEHARPIDPAPDSVVSPVDGVLEEWGIISQDSEMTVKQKQYSVQEMLGSEEKARDYSGGTYLVLYLSPSHYHRIHSPVNGKVLNSTVLGQKSYPVNRMGLAYGHAPLAKNYRQVTELESGGRKIAMAKVGAMFINSVVLTSSNEVWGKGEEVAYFSFGSTVVLLFEKGAFSMEASLQAAAPVKVGQVIGILHSEGQ